jgi:hypothetical protein
MIGLHSNHPEYSSGEAYEVKSIKDLKNVSYFNIKTRRIIKSFIIIQDAYVFNANLLNTTSITVSFLFHKAFQKEND